MVRVGSSGRHLGLPIPDGVVLGVSNVLELCHVVSSGTTSDRYRGSIDSGSAADPLDPPVASYQTALFWDPGHQTGMATQCCDDGSSESGCCCLEVCCCAGWWRWLVKTFPAYPHNRAGGLVGYWVGTHPNRLTYQGDRCGVDRLLGLRAYRDLRHDLTLMTAVQSSLAELRCLPTPTLSHR